ncbi:autotransporter-associated beta strand repeat-containing protein [Luteolibacter flavescens]|uniref:Autotransporter-associated beta strand repeat-containing protein n=1 Tax=Luteolibacter flavescens TaxID=1859460 RepID=A0ABT3FSW5_9BACT|nr:autotransporter-associated beta strand repeat-containing protein [Luteolibacter flavescens]MCW1886673.1 autotransporter-associated beta strand repeat-containing protein [Luteolibacter flavescens]
MKLPSSCLPLAPAARLSLLTTALTLAVQSAPLTWNSAGPSNDWSTAAGNGNWNPGGVVWTQNADAVFDGSSGTPESINVTTNNIVNDITFGVSGFSISSAGAGQLILSNDLASTFTVMNAADTATIGETLANNTGTASSLTKAGAGTLNLNGAAGSSYSGGTTINAGTLIASHEGSLGVGPVVNNATLNLNKANVTFTGISTALSGAGTVNVTALGTVANSVMLNGDHSNFTGTWNIGVGATAGAGRVWMNGPDNAAATINVLPHATFFSTAGIHHAAITLGGGDTGESLGQFRLDTAGNTWTGPITLAGEMTGAGDGIVGTNAGPVYMTGIISESGGSRPLTKVGGGTLVLSGNNSYSGATRIMGGNISVASINNSGASGPLGTNALISLGTGGTAGTLLYTGTGETTNRTFDLGGTSGTGGINHSGTGLLKITGNVTASGLGSRALSLNGSTAGTGEISGQIQDNTTTGSTTLGANFAAAATTITLASVDGITVGAAISGTGIASGTTVTAINTGTRVVTVTPATSGAGTAGAIITVAGVVNRTSVVKNNGTGLWTLSGNNTFTGNVTVNTGDLVITSAAALGVGPKSVTVVPTANPASLSSLVLDGTGGDISLSPDFSFFTSYDGNAVIVGTPLPGEGAIINKAGNNTIAGSIVATTGGGGTTFLSSAGHLSLTGTLSSNVANRGFNFRGASTGSVSGPITDGTNPVNVFKDGGLGIWTLSGSNTNTGSTTVTEGTLRLDYSVHNDSKLSDGALNMNGGTIDLSGGSHDEIVSSTNLAPGKTSYITRSSGNSTIQLRNVTANAGSSLVLGASGIAKTDNYNINGILPWARVMVAGKPVLATNATDDFDGPIVPYAGGYSDITRLGPSSIPDNAGAIVRIVNGGTTGNITLANSPLTHIGFLQMDASAGSATISPANASDVLMVGEGTGGYIWQAPAAGSLVLGSAVNQGQVTTLYNTLNLTNDSAANPLVVNSIIADNGTDSISLTTGGGNSIVLNGDNTFTGSLNAGAGLLTLTGANTFDGTLTVNNGATVVLSGNNTGRPAASASRTVINSGGVLQLQANAGNTVSGISSALSVERTALQPLILNSGGILQLRSEAPVTFAGGNAIGGMGSANVTFDVNNLGTGTGNVLTIAPTGYDVNTTTVNVTGGNGYSLATGPINNVSGGGTLTLNPTSANYLVGGYTANATFSTNVVLSGTAAGNQVTGPINNPGTSGATTLIKNGTSTWLLSGGSNYTGNTTISEGTLKAGNAAAFGVSPLLTVNGTGVLDLNGFNASFNNVAGGAITASITDTSAGAGTTTLSAPGLGNTIVTRILNGPSKAVRVLIRNANSGVTPFGLDVPNTFAGGLVLANGTSSGTRLRITGTPVTNGPAGAIVSSPWGTGPIIIGETATDKAGILLDTMNGYTVANAITFNTALGTDQPGIRLDTSGHTFSGTITASLSRALFTNTGSARLTGKVTGPLGFELNPSTVAITLANQTASANDYAGDTTIGAGTTLVIGAPNQIPNGASKGSVTNNGTLNLAGHSDTINGLNGSGLVTASSAATLTIGDNNTSATFTGSTGGALGITKTGSGFQTITGAIGHQGDTTVSQGTLAINVASTFADGADVRLQTGGMLILTAAGTDVVDQLFINGAPQAVGKWGRPGSVASLGADFETPLISGEGLLSVTSANAASPYATWIDSFFPGVTDPAIIGQTADPDKDGVDNLTEFAFGGHPNNGSIRVKIYSFAVDSDFDGDTNKELILTAAIRTGAGSFGTGSPSTAASVADGITYSIQGSTNLNGFPATVNPVPTAITTDLPPAGSGYSYRSFSLGGSNGLPGKGFLRATVTAP